MQNCAKLKQVSYLPRTMAFCIVRNNILKRNAFKNIFIRGLAQMRVFDRDLKRIHRDRAALGEDCHQYDHLRDAIAQRLTERLSVIKRKFPVAVDLGAGSGFIRRHLQNNGEVEKLIQLEMSARVVIKFPEAQLELGKKLPVNDRPGLEVVNIVGDEESIPLEPQSADLVISNLSLHWVNDLPSTFEQVHRILKPDGVFIAALLGGDTLQELRSAFALADMERLGGLSPHTSPFAGVADVGNLITRAGFNLPTVDQEKITVKFPDAFTLMEYLRGMGESNADLSRQPYVSRDVFLAAAAAYDALYRDADGFVDATFNIIYLIGWSPHESQPKPKRRGSATHHMRDLEAEMMKNIDEQASTADASQTAGASTETSKTPL